MPRTWRFAPIEVVRADAKRPEHVNLAILACFALGASVRQVGEALLLIVGGKC